MGSEMCIRDRASSSLRAASNDGENALARPSSTEIQTTLSTRWVLMEGCDMNATVALPLMFCCFLSHSFLKKPLNYSADPMPTLISDAELPIVTTDLSLSESERRAQLHQLSKDHWVAKSDLGYVIASHDDCAAMLRDRRGFSALSLIAETQNYESPEWSNRSNRQSILSTEGEDCLLYTSPSPRDS